MGREHYLYVNMRDVGCNCGERATGIEQGKAARDGWFAGHLARVTPPAASDAGSQVARMFAIQAEWEAGERADAALPPGEGRA